MENELLEDKFKDIDEKVDFLIELCQALQQENEELLTKVKTLDGQIAEKSMSEEHFVKKQGYPLKAGYFQGFLCGQLAFNPLKSRLLKRLILKAVPP